MPKADFDDIFEAVVFPLESGTNDLDKETGKVIQYNFDETEEK